MNTDYRCKVVHTNLNTVLYGMMVIELCLKNLQLLESCSLIKMDDGLTLQHTGLVRNFKRLFCRFYLGISYLNIVVFGLFR